MALSSELQLAFHLRVAFDQWQRDSVGGPWDDIIGLLARIVDAGQLDLESATRLDFLLRRTTGDNDPATCTVCGCNAPGLSHGTLGVGGCPDLRLHERSDDGLCRYCRVT